MSEERQGFLDDLQVGDIKEGKISSIVSFGAFVDIGLHDSGLVHVSQLSSGFIRDPYASVVVGQSVKVWVLELDKTRRRVALTMIKPGTKPVHGASRGRSQNPRKKFAANSTQKKVCGDKGITKWSWSAEARERSKKGHETRPWRSHVYFSPRS